MTEYNQGIAVGRGRLDEEHFVTLFCYGQLAYIGATRAREIAVDLLINADRIDQTQNIDRLPRPPVRLTDDEIRRIHLLNGFTVKDGFADLKPYVYDTARAIEVAVLKKNGLEVKDDA